MTAKISSNEQSKEPNKHSKIILEKIVINWLTKYLLKVDVDKGHRKIQATLKKWTIFSKK